MSIHNVINLFYLSLPQSPPKGATIPYRPKPPTTPLIFAGGQVGQAGYHQTTHDTIERNQANPWVRN